MHKQRGTNYKTLYNVITRNNHALELSSEVSELSSSYLDYTIEFYPEEGMYHFDGHRDCGFSCNGDETKRLKGICPKCKKPLILGVDYRVTELADREMGFKPEGVPGFKKLVELDKIGDPTKIVSGTTQLTKSPDRLYIAELTAKFVQAAGIMKEGFSFQAGAGGTALGFAIYLKELMKSSGIKARFIRGGSTKYLVEMLEDGLTDYILDGQTFDLEGIRSMRENPGHVNTSPFTSYNWHGKGNFASMIDCVVLGATEVDVDFNANVVTHSDGRLLHGIGGWQNCLFSKCTILPVPSFRNRIPIIVDKVTTLVGPGELIDVVVTERGTPFGNDETRAARRAGLLQHMLHIPGR